MRKVILFFTIIIIVVGAVFLYFNSVSSEDKVDSPIESESPKYIQTDYIIQEGDTFAVIMEEQNIGYEEMIKILECASSTFDFTSIRVGKEMRFFHDEMGVLKILEYEDNTEDFVRLEFSEFNFCTARIVPIIYDIETDYISGVVSSSLWLSGLEVGMSDELIIKFADIFAWTVDFSVEVRNGDQFYLLYERRFRDGQYVGTGRILASEFINVGRSFRGYLFYNEADKPAYYNERGESLIKQFLKAPLQYKYISSGYTTARFHPITEQTTPHLAIDYAASIGTPVMAVGDGTVTSAGWNGGYGNYIDVQHNDIYSTQYAHLSAYAKGIKRGVKVSQGQVIGYVGSTGWSTGPHLHYQIKKYGQKVNPLTVDLPPADPVEEERMSEFLELVRQYDKIMKK